MQAQVCFLGITKLLIGIYNNIWQSAMKAVRSLGVPIWHTRVHSRLSHQDEMDALVRGTILAYPRRFLISSARQALLQLVALRTGDEMRVHSDNNWNIRVIQRVLPVDFSAFSNARQFDDHMLPLADAVAPVHVAIFWLSVAGCALFAWTGRFARINKFLALALVFLIINASVCGAFAGVFDRYQTRAAWIVPICLIAYICCFIRDWKHGVAGQDPIDPLPHTEI